MAQYLTPLGEILEETGSFEALTPLGMILNETEAAAATGVPKTTKLTLLGVG